MNFEDPNEPSPVQQLLRLKRYEKPAEDYVEEFVTAFHERQRSELLKQSARGLLWERATTYWENLAAPKWGAAAAAVIALLAAGWWMSPESNGTGKPQFANRDAADFSLGGGFQVEAGMILVDDPEEPAANDNPLLLSRHFSGGYADDARQVKSMKPLTSNSYLQIQSRPGLE